METKELLDSLTVEETVSGLECPKKLLASLLACLKKANMVGGPEVEGEKRKVNNVRPSKSGDDERKVILLRERFDGDTALLLERVPALAALIPDLECVQVVSISVVFRSEELSMNSILRKLLPSTIGEIPSLFSLLFFLHLKDDLFI